MNVSKQFYENSLQNLAGSHQVRTTAQVIADRVDEKKELGLTLTSEFGNQLIGSSGIVSIQKASNFYKASKAEKAKQVAQAIGDKIKTTLRPSVDDDDDDVYEDAREPEIQRDPDFGNEEFETRDPEGDDPDFFAQMGGRAVARDSTQGITESTDGSLRAGQLPQAPQEGQEVGEALTDASNEVTGATEGVEGALETATEASSLGDDNPVGIGITAALGVATLLTGLFIHPHHSVVVQPAQKIIPNNFGVQAGLN